MKRKLLPLTALTLTAAAIGVCGLGSSVSKADASVNPLVLLNDDFNDSQYKGSLNTNKWTSKTATSNSIHQSLESECYLDNNTGSGNAGTTAIATNRVLNGIKSFQFDMKYDNTAKTTNKWLSVYLVNDYEDMFTTYTYDGLFRAHHNAVFNAGSTFDKANFNFNDCLGTNPVNDWITFKITFNTSTTGYINACVQGGTFVDSNKVGFTYSKTGIDLKNAYLGLSVSNEGGEIKLDNFKLEHSGEPLETDFSHIDPTDPESDFVYKVTQSAGKQGDLSYCTFTIVDNGSLEFHEAAKNDYIYSNVEVTDPEGTITELDVVDLSFTVKITQTNYKLGIVFGYNPTEENLYKDTLVYEISKFYGVLKEYDSDGNQTLPEETNKNNLKTVNDVSSINIVINKKNGISITENGTPVTYADEPVEFSDVNNYFGNVALVLLEKGSTTPVICHIDQFKLKTHTYYVPKTKSVTHNFSNDYWGNEENPDFYVAKSEGESSEVKDGRLVWKGASDRTYFGSAHQYDNFILEFKLCAIYGDNTAQDPHDITGKNKWIGLDLSRETVDTAEWSSYLSILTVITPDETMTSAPVWLNANKLSPITVSEVDFKRHKEIPCSMFEDITYSDPAEKSLIKEGDAVCFKYVSEGGNISMYLKKACEVNYTKIMTCYNLKLQGYFALCCTGYTYLELDDFSMSNTSPIYTCADNDVPQTITKTITEVIYDDQNNPINLSEELKINTGLINTLMIVFASTTGVACGVIVFLVVRIKIKKGKEHKHE